MEENHDACLAEGSVRTLHLLQEKAENKKKKAKPSVGSALDGFDSGMAQPSGSSSNTTAFIRPCAAG